MALELRYAVVQHGESRSFPEADPFVVKAGSIAEADVIVCVGTVPPSALVSIFEQYESRSAILVELGLECLALYVDELAETESNVLGFSRYRNGNDAPSPLIELVRPRVILGNALESATAVFDGAGFSVALCSDHAGRIIDRLVRPKYNAALRFMDEGLASQQAMDLTCRLGLGYPDGPIERVLRGGLVHHYQVSQALFEIYGTPAYAPGRLAAAAAKRSTTSS